MDWGWITWKPADIAAAAQAALNAKKAAHEAVKAVPANQRTFENTIGALAAGDDLIADVSQVAQLLMDTHPEAAIRNAAQSTNDHLEAAAVDLDHDHGLWEAAQQWVATGESLDPVDRKLADDTLRDLRRMGFALPPEQFEELKKLRKELQKMQAEFEKTINDWEDHIELTREQLAGLPDRYIDGLRRTTDGKYMVSLQYPDMIPFMDLADDDAARRELAHKSLRKGGPGNLARLARMIELRQRIAALLGYPTHADRVMEVRMAHSPSVVHEFLKDVLAKVSPAAHREMKDLVMAKKRMLGLEHPKPIHFHEVAYWAEKLNKEKYGFDSEAVKAYFPVARVVEGMLAMYADMFGLRFERQTSIPVWHPDVSCYSVTDAENGRRLGFFFLDLYPRVGKYGHAAAFPVRLARNGFPENIMALVCNFPKPTPTNPGLLDHKDEVATLLHEFGHCMHAILSGGRWQRQSGYAVSWDFIEALSQIFEYWAWDPRAIARLSGHWKTGEPLPPELWEKMKAGRRFREASFFLGQAVRALYDLRMHTQPTDAPVEPEHLAKMHRDMRLEYEHIDLPDNAIMVAGWGHMADYDAGYYGYLWSKVYAADMFTRFEQNPLDPTVGRRYRSKVLAPGSTKPERELVRDFLERESTNAAFLKELGIA